MDLKETYILKGETELNKEYNSVNGLGRSTKVLLLASFKENYYLFRLIDIYSSLFIFLMAFFINFL